MNKQMSRLAYFLTVVHAFAINWQLESAEEGEWLHKLFHDQISPKESARRGNELMGACMPNGHAFHRATVPSQKWGFNDYYEYANELVCFFNIKLKDNAQALIWY